jgi:hypothetical protein
MPSSSKTPVPTNTGTPTLEPRIEGLQSNPPWLIISAKDGLWVSSMNGAHVVSLLDKSYESVDLHQSISPATHQIAVLTSVQDDPHSLGLELVFLPDGGLLKVTDLTSPDTEPDAQALRAIRQAPSYAWSPDGSQLAFVGALDGANAGVYVFDLTRRTVQKISQDDGQDFSPSWSPDGKSILYFQGDFPGTEPAVKGVWLATADGSKSEVLESSESAGEQLLGWRDHETAVLISKKPDSDVARLRLFNIHSHEQTVLQEGGVFGAAVATGNEAYTGTILYNKSDGLYLLRPESTEPQKLSEEQVNRSDYSPSISWQAEGVIFVVRFRGGNLSSFVPFSVGSSDNNIYREDAPLNPLKGLSDVSSFGLIWGWTNNNGTNGSVWVTGPGIGTLPILKKAASFPVWNLDNDLLFFAGRDLYRSPFKGNYSDTAVVASLDSDVLDVAWMGFEEAFDKKYHP